MGNKKRYRLVLVEWVDNIQSDSYPLDCLINMPKFRTQGQAIKWANKNLNKINSVVDKEIYATDLYIEEWDNDFVWCTNEWLHCSLHFRGTTANV